MTDLLEYIKKMQEMYGDDVITTADKINRPEPKKEVQEIEAINAFMKRNPKAGGGMLVKPSADGSRPGYSGKKGPKSKNPYLKDKNFLKYAEENFNWTPDIGTKGVKGGPNLASMMEQYEKSLATKNKIVGVQALIDALGENNPYSRDSITKAFSLADKKITKNILGAFLKDFSAKQYATYFSSVPTFPSPLTLNTVDVGAVSFQTVAS